LLVSLFAHVMVPLFALVAVAVIEFERDTPLSWQVAEVGTDLCILAIGATGSVLINPKLLARFGPEWTILVSILVVLATVTLAGVSIHVKRSRIEPERRAKVNFSLGLFAVTLVAGIVVWGAR
jgi:MFS-type transporter involved in bile tolerance (Atg22 family)